MKLILFSKHFAGLDLATLADQAKALNIDGYDLAVRAGQAVHPQNVTKALPEAVSFFKKEGLVIPMVTARGDLLSPEDPEAKPLLEAMDRADVRLLKLGYFHYPAAKAPDYWDEVSRVRSVLEKWGKLGATYQVRICYHTHSATEKSYFYLGSNASNLMHLLKDQDPRYLGAYLDTGHLEAEGEPFDYAVSIAKKYFSILSVKDVAVEKKNGEKKIHWVPAGEGRVGWDGVFASLAQRGFDGPVSIHAEYKCEDQKSFLEKLPAEITFFQKLQESYLSPLKKS